MTTERTCPSCGHTDVTETWESTLFEYGLEGAQKMIRLPVLHCQPPGCGQSYTDERAERIRDKAALT